MKLFVFYANGGLTKNYHSGGAGIVCATTLAEAIKLVESERSKEWTLDGFKIEPLQMLEGDVLIFQDAGCC